ncbi:J domain-containing protein CG6693-like [Sitodiplosis mosellana]|uniref:J domain-containing protein CG6693-like n=1 Tax=Sitodiplosis mosellana TaxID=263140 RepID=UPI002444BB04|nr:J domain-containing protein CG6693-like [Sitodiplosis mosellana]
MSAEKYFGTRDLYQILQLKPNAEIQDVKKSFYKLALTFHPDRVPINEKEEAKEKFNVIHNAYSILSDIAKKEMYDNGSRVLFTKVTIAAQWENFLKPVSCEAKEEARKKYQGSLQEKTDLIREFVAGKGSLTYVLNNLPFMRSEDEMRIIEILKDLIDKGDIPKIPIKKIRR